MTLLHCCFRANGNPFFSDFRNFPYFCSPIFSDETICCYLFLNTVITGHLCPFRFLAQEKVAVAPVELAAVGRGHSLRSHLLGHEYSSTAFVKSLLLYINMYRPAQTCLYDGFYSFQNIPYLLERGEKGGSPSFPCLHFRRTHCDDLRLHGRPEKVGGKGTDPVFLQPPRRV